MINLQDLNDFTSGRNPYSIDSNFKFTKYNNFDEGVDSTQIDTTEESLPGKVIDIRQEGYYDNKPTIKVANSPKITPFVNTYNAISASEFAVNKKILSKIQSGAMTEFFIKYNNDGKYSIYQFAIAPALESNIGGAGQTPEVKPGLLFRTSNAIKTFTIPGGTPVFQVLGIEPTVFQLNGLFIGAEGNPNASTSELTPKIYSPTSSMSAVASAEIFDKEVARSNRLVEVHLYSNNHGPDKKIEIKYQCLIQNARYFLKRSDRVYYALDFYVIKHL